MAKHKGPFVILYTNTHTTTQSHKNTQLKCVIPPQKSLQQGCAAQSAPSLPGFHDGTSMVCHKQAGGGSCERSVSEGKENICLSCLEAGRA